MEEQNFQNNQNQYNVEPTQTENNYQDYTQAFQSQPVVQQNTKEPNSTLAIVSLVLGIISIVSGCCGGGMMFGIGGIICAVFANKQGKTGMSKGGMICSIIGVVLSLIMTIVCVIFYVFALSLEYGY